jgi:GT2 family glycosyltransferase
MTPPAAGPPVSVIIASRHRPEGLLRTLRALGQQDHPAIEVVVVADPAAAARVAGPDLKVQSFDQANLAAARNAGLALAAAPVVAFLDDDAVPEPTWASRLAAPFADPRVTQAGGYVRGRNGISFQWRAIAVDATGADHPLALPETVTLHPGSAAWAIKTQGTNCAFRRTELIAAGGFDPAFRFYLDDADANLRLAARGGLTAVVPRAQVQHGFGASPRRRADRAPLSLHDIGASAAVFLRRHAPDRIGPALDRLRAAQRRRLVAMMVDGRIAPGDVSRLLVGLEQGIADGRHRALAVMLPMVLPAPPAFRALSGTGPRPAAWIVGRSWRAGALAAEARAVAASGRVTSLLSLGPGLRPHRAGFSDDGYWWQSGGLHGPSDRADPAFRWWRLAARARREAARIAEVRPMPPA